MEEIQVGEMWRCFLTLADSIRDHIGPLEHRREQAPDVVLRWIPTHPRETRKILSPGCKQVHDFSSDVSPSSRQAAQIFQEKGAKGTTQLQNTKPLAVGGLGNKRGILRGARGSRGGKGMF